MPLAARRRRASPDIWPGFVDALSALLIFVIFLLMVFTLAQMFLAETLSGRDEALERLNRQIAELSEMLALERGANAELRGDLSQISAQLQASIAARDRLSNQLAEILPDRDALSEMVGDLTRERNSFSALLAERTRERDDLAGKLTDLTSEARVATERAEKIGAKLEDAFKVIGADKEKIELQLRRIASIERDIDTLGALRKKLEKQVAELAATLKSRDVSLANAKSEIEQRTKVLAERDKALANRDKTIGERERELGALRDRSKELEARLATEQERTLLSQKGIDEKDVHLKLLLQRAGKAETALGEEKKISSEAQRQVALLNSQILALRQQLARIEKALEASEIKTREQEVQIVDLGSRLNLALASKVEELARYRSEFFGRLREVLGDRKDIRIVGDRFVFQSEVLFLSGSALLQEDGQAQITRLGQTLLEISRKIPKELNWVLRVDGHTDRIPIKTSLFPSNWELSTSRAISVVQQLIKAGIPANRLAATGFGEHQPLDARDDEIAYRRNRRIELKLTER